jgi:UDP-N-acetylmuramoyl-tripeptide--D-alanyl-D-alanine ligase
MAAMKRDAQPDAMPLSVAAAACRGRVYGADVAFCGAAIDSRAVAPGELFVALPGTRVDGHDFIGMARERGAAAAVVQHAVNDALPQLVVDDTRLALGKIAALWRTRYRCPIVALTGSNGKTTVKELVAAILARRGQTLATIGNLNNDIGMPLTLLRLRADHAYAVIEMGANHPGEIAYMTDIARPDVALITNAGPAHLEGFGSINGVAHGKGEIYSGLSERGIAIVNADDQYAPYWEQLNGRRRIVRFGLGARAEIRAEWSGDAAGSRLTLHTPSGTAQLALHLPGRHSVMNALAATAAALAVGATLADVVAGLEGARGAPGRLQSMPGRNGARVIDDTYNANPASTQAAIDVLAACSGRRVLVLGDLAELGANSEALHRDIGAAAARAQIDALYTVGKLSTHAAAAFEREHAHFDSQEALIAHLQPLLQPEVTVLVKGSRSARMENVVQALTGEVSDAH